MSRAKKHVIQGYDSELVIPHESQSVARVTDLRGGNVCEIEYPNGDRVLSLIPAKFKNVLWIRKGNPVIVEPEADQQYAGKVRTTIVHMLSPDHVKDLKKLGKWPPEFDNEKKQVAVQATDNKSEVADDEEDEEHSDNDDDLFVNRNHHEDTASEEEDEEDSDN